MKILIGARGSKLSLKQTNIIKDKLLKINPELQIEIKIISTKGDTNLAPIPLDTVGKGWFTKELDRELLSGNIDIAIHSLKDLQETLPEGLIIAGIPEREDARDVLVSKKNILLKNLPANAIIGTDSIRRKVQIHNIRPDLIVKSIRGNVDSRLKKLDGNAYDAIMVAAAGLIRLGLKTKITEFFAVTTIIPSPGQGTLAIVVNKENKEIYNVVKQLNNLQAVSETYAERAFSKQIGGGCKTPTGAYASVQGDLITIHGMIGSEDEKHIIKDRIQGPSIDAKQLGIALAEKLTSALHKKNKFLENKHIVITRPEPENEILEKRLKQYGAQVYNLPTIKIIKNTLDTHSLDEIKKIDSFDWIIFTSVKGVEFFIRTLQNMHIHQDILANKKIAVVGPKTAEKVQSYNLTVDFMPSKYTTEQLAMEIEGIAQKKLLLARSTIGSKQFIQDLKAKDATVIDISIYRTTYFNNHDLAFENLIKNNKIDFITFTSPSTVIGFFEKIINPQIIDLCLTIPVISVGPVTTRTAEKYGFRTIHTADEYTTDGMLKKLREIV